MVYINFCFNFAVKCELLVWDGNATKIDQHREKLFSHFKLNIIDEMLYKFEFYVTVPIN